MNRDASLLVLVFFATSGIAWSFAAILADLRLDRGAPGGDRDGCGVWRRTAHVSRALSLVGAGAALAVALAVGVLHPLAIAALMLVVAALLYPLPAALLSLRVRRRRARFAVQLLDLATGLGSGLQAGCSLAQALTFLARDLGGPAAEELKRLLNEHRLGIDLAEGFRRLCVRMPGEDLQLLASAVCLTLQTGGSLAEVLGKIAATIRERMEFQERLRTMTTQGRFEAVALALGPAMAFVVLNAADPRLMQPMLHTPTGWCAMALIAALELLGYLCIRQIVKVEV